MDSPIDEQSVAKLIECFINPVMSKILLVLHERSSTTAKQLSQELGEVAPATLYRYLKRMTDDGILKIAETRKVRAVEEKVYAIGIDMDMGLTELLQQNRGDVYLALFRQFMAGLLREFEQYAARSDIDIVKDGSGFSAGPLYLSDEEFANLMNQIGALINPISMRKNENEPGKKMRTLAVIITPPKPDEE